MNATLAQPPATHTGLRLTVPETAAVGFPALFSALSQMNHYMHWADAVKASLKMNQKGGFDCSGCAWPDPDGHRSSLGEYCENGIKALAEEATYLRVTPAFFKEHSVATLGTWSDFELGKAGRLTDPMVLRPGSTHYEPIRWEEAYALIAGELNALDSPDEAAFYTSGRTGNEAAFLYQLFVREFGTNNLPDCSNLCHESTSVALAETLGIGKGSVTLHDLYDAEVILVIGQNPGTNHPRMLSALEKCRENGGKIVSINPLPETGLIRFVNPQRPFKLLMGGTELETLFLQVRINGDAPLLKAVMLLLLEAEERNPGAVFDLDFIRDQTTGIEAFLADLRKQDFAALVHDSGVPEAKIRELANLLIPAQRIIICWAMGVTQHRNSVDIIRDIVNLLLLKGSIGKPGAGTCPVRGHSNVQGDRTMGIWERPPVAFLDSLKAVFGFEPPRDHGYTVTEAIQAMHEGKVKTLIGLGGNFLSASPDTEFTAEALRRCRLTVHISTKLNRSHLIHGHTALILPALARSDRDFHGGEEQFVSTENSTGVVQSSKGVLAPPSAQLRSEVSIVTGIAREVLNGRTVVDWDHLAAHNDHVREKIEATIPGFDRYNERVRQPGGFYLPNGARNAEFRTKTGKALFTIGRYEPIRTQPGELLMMTIRSHDQYNTTIYGLDDRYRGIHHERRVVLMNAEDIAEQELTAGQPVTLFSEYDGERREAKSFLVVSYPIPKGCCATYYPETNVLIPVWHRSEDSKCPASKSVLVRVEKER
ncbi:MAG: FdhF/YdeP family oxidoreductase [Siphonobacter aquaeclarae]|nr:FdhF/YdeP family oxidoreductase [Siphonobacter aquaeclarae]